MNKISKFDVETLPQCPCTNYHCCVCVLTTLRASTVAAITEASSTVASLDIKLYVIQRHGACLPCVDSHGVQLSLKPLVDFSGLIGIFTRYMLCL